jgi:hypothetical protein
MGLLDLQPALPASPCCVQGLRVLRQNAFMTRRQRGRQKGRRRASIRCNDVRHQMLSSRQSAKNFKSLALRMVDQRISIAVHDVEPNRR